MPVSILLVLVSIAISTYASVTVPLSAAAPDGVSSIISPSFPAFAFEERSFYYVAGPVGHPNVFSRNLINSIGNRTNARPAIRVGGTSLQRATYNSSQTEALIIPESQIDNIIPTGLKLGPSFFKSFTHFPSAMYLLDLPMGPSSDLDTSVLFAQTAYNTIGADSIISLELGNEPDRYGPQAYTPDDYVQDFKQYSVAIAQGLGLTKKTRTWQIGSLGTNPAKIWNTTYLFGQLDSAMDRIGSFTEHYYQYNARGVLNVSAILMDHENIVDGLSPMVDTINTLNSRDDPIWFNLAEIASGLGGLADNSSYRERTFGAALWQVDFMLYAMSIGVHRTNFQTALGQSFSLFQPVTFPFAAPGTPPAVFANYYALAFAADFIGRCGDAQILNIPLPDTQHTAAYAMYVNSSLARVALVNFNYWNGSDPDAGTRGEQVFQVQIPSGLDAKTVQVSRLASPLGAGGLDEDDFTWAGENWSYASNGLPKQTGTASETVSVKNGYASVTVNDSEAVMIILEDVETDCDIRSP